MSDVYAMGGEVLFGLNIAAWPEDAPISELERVFEGAVDKVAEAGGVVAGGHTVIDREPKYGLAVTGRVHPERMLLKSRLLAGDALWLTKPIGTGVLTTAHKAGALDPADLASAIASMVALNRDAAHAAVDAELHAATDITGFGLVGHAHEMAERSGIAVRIRAAAVPLLPAARAHAERGISFGGLERNTAYFDDGVRVRRYAVSYVNGEESNRHLIDEFYDPEPVDSVIYYPTRKLEQLFCLIEQTMSHLAGDFHDPLFRGSLDDRPNVQVWPHF